MDESLGGVSTPSTQPLVQCIDFHTSSLINQPHVVTLGKPSAKLAEKLEKDEQARIAAQKDRLGPKGLAAAEQLLEEAKKEHDKEIPKDVLASFPVPDVKSISWIPVQSLQEPGKGEGRRRLVEQSDNAELAKHIQGDGQELPFFVQYDHVQVCIDLSDGCGPELY